MSETRQAEETKIFKLILNPMAGRCEHENVIAISDDMEKLKSFYIGEFSEKPYQHEVNDRIWNKVFKKGSILEWYNDKRGNYYATGPFEEEWVNTESIESLKDRIYFVE